MLSKENLYYTIISLPEKIFNKSIEILNSSYNKNQSGVTKNSHLKQTIISVMNILELACCLYFFYNYSYISLLTILLLKVIEETVQHFENTTLEEYKGLEYVEKETGALDTTTSTNSDDEIN